VHALSAEHGEVLIPGALRPLDLSIFPVGEAGHVPAGRLKSCPNFHPKKTYRVRPTNKAALFHSWIVCRHEPGIRTYRLRHLLFVDLFEKAKYKKLCLCALCG
jgi:hypothetical protein